jgi:hypothetical protein
VKGKRRRLLHLHHLKERKNEEIEKVERNQSRIKARRKNRDALRSTP